MKLCKPASGSGLAMTVMTIYLDDFRRAFWRLVARKEHLDRGSRCPPEYYKYVILNANGAYLAQTTEAT